MALTAAAALAAPLAKAVPVGYTITLTELSSTVLTATYNGPGATFSVVLNSPDFWTVTFAPTPGSTFSLDSSFIFDWTEPENPLQVNEVVHGFALGQDTNLYVSSDESLEEYGGGGTVTNPNGIPVPVGTDNGLTVFLKFDDQAAASETGVGVPESGSTLALFGLSITGLVGLTRFRRLQSA